MLKCIKLEYKIQGGDAFSISNHNEITDRKIYNKLQSKNIITLAEYKKYLNRGNKLIDAYAIKRKIIEIRNAIYLLKKRFTTYVSPDTNIQFKTIYHSNIINKNRLMEMISYFVHFNNIESIERMIKVGEEDSDIIKEIKRNLHFKKDIHSKVYRIHEICNSIIKFLPKRNTKPKILDIGIGSGKKTVQLQEIIGCDIYGADVKQWGPYKLNEKSFSFPVRSIQKKPYHIPYSDNSFDCITLILVIHHAEDIIEMILECKRLLKDDGILVIIEHDVWSDEINMVLDIQHLLYASIKNEKGTYYAKYYNFYEWDILFDKCKMYPVYGSHIHEDASHRLRYDAQFIAIYKKT